MRKSIAATTAVSSIIFTFLTNTVFAQDAEDEKEVEKVIVVGSKLAFGLQETVDSVEVLTQERLQNDGVFELSDALARTPNVSIIGGDLNSISIRGISRNGTGGAGPGEAINIFVDGAPLSLLALTGSADVLWDVGQVEVLRGSQSILQGRNAIAGAVVLTTNDPTYEWEGSGRVILGEFGERRYSGVISGPLIDNQLAFRLSADYSESNGFVINDNTGQSDNRADSLALRGKLLIEPSIIEDLRAELIFEHTTRDSLRISPLIVGVLAPDDEDDFSLERIARLQSLDPTNPTSFSLFQPSAEVETNRVITDIRYDFTGNIFVNFIGTYEQADAISNSTELRDNPFSDVGTFADREGETYSADLRVNFDYEKLAGVIGLYYFETDSVSNAITADVITDVFSFPIDPFESVFSFDSTSFQETDNKALYTSWRYEPNDKWIIDFGFRLDEEEFSNQSIVNDTIAILPDTCTVTIPLVFLGIPLPGAQTVPCEQAAGVLQANLPDDEFVSNSFGVFLPSAAVTYRITDEHSVFVGARRGYRAGGVALAGSIEDLASAVSLIEFDPEFLNTIEAGWRTLWLDDRLTFNGAFYFSEYEDQQVSFTDDTGLGITTNAGRTILYGVEMSFDYNVTENLEIYGSLALKDTEFTDFILVADNPDTPEDETTDLTGNELDEAENLSFTLGAVYNHPNGFFASAAVSYKSSYFTDIFNLDANILPGGLTEEIDAAAVVNTTLGYRADNWTVSAVVQNLFDEDTPESANFAGPGILNGTDGLTTTGSFTVRPPRTVSLILAYDF